MFDNEGVQHNFDYARMKLSMRVPSYRRRRDSDQAIGTLSDAITKKRRDYWLGTHGSAESRERYFNVVAQREATGRRLPPPQRAPRGNDSASGNGGHDREPTINVIIREYWNWARDYYSPSELSSQKSALRILRQHFGTTPTTQCVQDLCGLGFGGHSHC